jgi:EAL domain-containing protein (putative c-di-GMP-specific phosphodiesterase class I)
MTLDDCLAPAPRHDVEQVVDLALAEGGLRTLFQPIVDLRTSEAVGFEALTRGPRRSEFERPDRLFAAARADPPAGRARLGVPLPGVPAASHAGLRPPTRVFVNAEPQTIGTACPDHLLPDWVSAHRRLRVSWR